MQDLADALVKGAEKLQSRASASLHVRLATAATHRLAVHLLAAHGIPASMASVRAVAENADAAAAESCVNLFVIGV
jgi:hypothetical protein